MLVTRHNTPKPWSEISLTEQFVPQREDGILVPKGPLWDLVEHIGRFRMEGKNRRDSATGKEEKEQKEENKVFLNRVIMLCTIICFINYTPDYYFFFFFKYNVLYSKYACASISRDPR